MFNLHLLVLVLVAVKNRSFPSVRRPWTGKLETADGDLSEIINSFGRSQGYVDRFGGISLERLIITPLVPAFSSVLFYVQKVVLES